MKCKKHTTDLSSTVGVCASCLHERLNKVIQAEEQAQAQAQSQPQNNCNSWNTNPPVNAVTTAQRPYNKPRLNHSLSDQRFHDSPQIAINTGGCIGTGATSSNKKKKTLIKFSSFSNLFRSNGDGSANLNHKHSLSTSGEPSGAGGKPTSVTSSPLWLSNAHVNGGFGRRSNKPIHVNETSTTAASGVRRKQRRVRDRGMSPVRTSDDELSGSSGYESAEAESFKQTPKKTPVRRGGGQRSVSELVFCLSPLVRASPSRLWNLKGKLPVDGGFPAVPHLSDAKSFCANRSRKLADYGRSGRNR